MNERCNGSAGPADIGGRNLNSKEGARDCTEVLARPCYIINASACKYLCPEGCFAILIRVHHQRKMGWDRSKRWYNIYYIIIIIIRGSIAADYINSLLLSYMVFGPDGTG